MRFARSLSAGTLLALAAGTLLGACGSSVPRVRRVGDLEIELMTITRMAEHKVGISSITPAKPGDELAEVKLVLRGNAFDMVNVGKAEKALIDVDGTKHPSGSSLTFTFKGEGKETAWDLYFGVPKGMRLQELRIGSAVFPLGGLVELR